MAEQMQTGMGRDAPAGGSGLFQMLLGNPALLNQLISGLSGSGSTSDERDEEKSPSSEETLPHSGATASSPGESSAAPNADPLAAMTGSDPAHAIGAVLSDPQMMAKLPDMIRLLQPLMGNLSLSDSIAAAAKPAVQTPSKEGGVHAISAASGKGGGGAHDKRVALLCALRPYLSPHRQEAIDYILRMDRMGKLFRDNNTPLSKKD